MYKRWKKVKLVRLLWVGHRTSTYNLLHLKRKSLLITSGVHSPVGGELGDLSPFKSPAPLEPPQMKWHDPPFWVPVSPQGSAPPPLLPLHFEKSAYAPCIIHPCWEEHMRVECQNIQYSLQAIRWLVLMTWYIVHVAEVATLLDPTGYSSKINHSGHTGQSTWLGKLFI